MKRTFLFVPARFIALAFLTALAITAARADNSVIDKFGRVTVDHARFTVLSPTLIRLEWQPNNQFVDDPSTFAVNRQTRFRTFTAQEDSSGALILDTNLIQLRWKPDGRSFSPANLRAKVRRGSQWVEWYPGLQPSANLGGTIRTLDQLVGPVDLGAGLIGRDGWAVVDDSGTAVRPAGGWFHDRAQPAGLDWYLFGYGQDFHAAFKDLALVAGRVPLPRRYLLGAWYSRYWPYSAEEFKAIVAEYAQHDFPLDVLVMDMDWHLIDTQVPGVARGYLNQVWTGYTWNQQLIPDPAGLIDWIHQQGLAVTLNDHPADGLQPHEATYPDYMRAAGQDATQHRTIPFDAGNIDYLNLYWRFSHAPHEAEGVDFWWLDWQQYPQTRSVQSLTNLDALNHYYFERSVAHGLRGVSFSRWAGWGDHRHPIHFSGDSEIAWDMLAFEIPFTTTAGNVGCFFWSHDIGGHHRGLGRNDELYTRWVQFGAFSAALRSHSTRNAELDRRPWTYSPAACSAMRVAFHLRSEFFPYLYTSAAQSCQQTWPLTRPLYLEYPDDERAYHNATEFLCGDDLLVAPICSPGTGPSNLAYRPVWFPPGNDWYDLFTSELHAGGSEALVAATLDEFPLYAKGGVPLPTQPYTPRMTSAPLKDLVVRCWPGQPGIQCVNTLYEDDGATPDYANGRRALTNLKYVRNGDRAVLTISPTEGDYQGQLRERAFTGQFEAVGKPTSAAVDGTLAPFTYDAATARAIVHVSARSIQQGAQIELVAPLADQTQLASSARQRRWSALLAHPVTALAELPPDISPALRTAALAIAGYGVSTKNLSPYLYRPVLRPYIYAPTSSEVVVRDQANDGTVRKTSHVVVSADSPFALDPQTPEQEVGDRTVEFFGLGTVVLPRPAPAAPK